MPSRFIRIASRTIPLAFLCVFIAACPPRKQITSNAPAFRLQLFNGRPLLFSPAIPAQQPFGQPILLKLAANNESPPTSLACSISRGMFRLERDPGDSDFQAVIAPPNKWLGPNFLVSDETDALEQLYIFLGYIDEADRAGCFAPSQIHARDYILQNVPTPPAASLFNAYGYRIERSGVDLKPNLRLKIERAYFSSPEKSDKNYLGVSSVFFDVATDSQGSVRFQQAQALQYSPASLAQSDHEGSRDLGILALKPQKYYRVLFYTHQVPTDRNFSAALIGADDSSRLDQFEQNLRADAGAPCSSSPHDDIQCLEFRGFVTVSVQIRIELNGQPKFVDWGTQVRNIVPSKSRKSLKIQRLFANSYFPVNFSRTDESIVYLTLVGGDCISW